MQTTRRRLLSRLFPAAGAFFFMRPAAGAAPRSEHLEARLTNGQIRVSAPHLEFVTGQTLQRLENGAPVPFAIQLALSADRFTTILQRDIERFVFSYDLWEEKFSVVRLGGPRKTVSHLQARAAEAWCISEMALSPGNLPGNQPFWLRLEIRAENAATDPLATSEDPVSLTRLVEIFSRRTRSDQARWDTEGGPFRLAALPQERTGIQR